MKIGDINKNYVFSTTIELEGENEFVKLREPTVQEIGDLNKVDEKDQIQELGKIFPACIIDHSFKKNDDDNKKASNEEVYKELQKSGSLMIDILSIWANSLPLNCRLQQKQK
jgi:hypothetical protein